MKMVSLFSGIGGFELAGEAAGYEIAVSCEINEFGRKVLEYYWPNAYHHDDVHTLTKDVIYEKAKISPADELILVGGFPCQPYSHAGKRLGKNDTRHLWPEMLRVIREIKPKWIVGENVAGIVSWSDGLVFQEVHTDLEAEGYSVQAVVLPASGVGAPHRRDRVWFVAYANNVRTSTGLGQVQGADGEVSQWDYDAKSGNAGQPAMADTNERAARPPRAGVEPKASGRHNNYEQESGGKQAEQYFGHGDVYRHNANTIDTRLQGRQDDRSTGRSGSQRNQQPPRLLCTKWDDFPTQSPIRKRDDGLSSQLVGITVSKHRNESIKAYGNAIVPQVALQIFKAINEYENQQ
jgi:DNA (cytosine-5)-methyltransferase 1